MMCGFCPGGCRRRPIILLMTTRGEKKIGALTVGDKVLLPGGRSSGRHQPDAEKDDGIHDLEQGGIRGWGCSGV